MDVFTLISLNQIASVVLRTVIIFIFAFFILRMLGKRSLSHFTYLDLLLVIALGSAVGDVMIYQESVTQILSSAVAITVVGVVVKLFNEFTSHSEIVSRLVAGQARLIVEDGKIIKRALSQEDMSEAELMAVLRTKEIDSLADIKKAFIEYDGEISVIRYNKK